MHPAQRPRSRRVVAVGEALVDARGRRPTRRARTSAARRGRAAAATASGSRSRGSSASTSRRESETGRSSMSSPGTRRGVSVPPSQPTQTPPRDAHRRPQRGDEPAVGQPPAVPRAPDRQTVRERDHREIGSRGRRRRGHVHSRPSTIEDAVPLEDTRPSPARSPARRTDGEVTAIRHPHRDRAGLDLRLQHLRLARGRRRRARTATLRSSSMRIFFAFVTCTNGDLRSSRPPFGPPCAPTRRGPRRS